MNTVQSKVIRVNTSELSMVPEEALAEMLQAVNMLKKQGYTDQTCCFSLGSTSFEFVVTGRKLASTIN